ncbi:hypothetical protein MIB92_09340 [Aestuariirhabdus sp. Z084]|uniref:hypothetical protein n=1 Tax=Aestuariirhabdus haliotis TaxID=2918751 RepID=UPI00201B439C|nr:hypothetical protein [Aestuariirhabdus haliotis]MCL6415856.1 hypothetical protein [Aestuariirhabdus haliotis]MCL6419842.1 hypothetical protein [Aestuariirhabdus haliotis]
MSPHNMASEAQVCFNFQVSSDHPSLAGHFPGNPIVPGVVILSRIIEGYLATFAARPCLQGIPRVKFLQPLLPDCDLAVTCTVRGNKVQFEGVIADEPCVRGVIQFLLGTFTGESA